MRSDASGPVPVGANNRPAREKRLLRRRLEISEDSEEEDQASGTETHAERAHASSPAPLIDLDGNGIVDAQEFNTYSADLAMEPRHYFGAEIVRLRGFVLHSGGTSAPYAGINGEYMRSGEFINGRALYVKSNKPRTPNTTAMWWANNNGKLSWIVGQKADAGTNKMWAYVHSLGWGPEQHAVGAWQVYSYNSKSFEAQHGATASQAGQAEKTQDNDNDLPTTGHEDDRASCESEDSAASVVKKDEQVQDRNNGASHRMRRSGDAQTFLQSLLKDPPTQNSDEQLIDEESRQTERSDSWSAPVTAQETPVRNRGQSFTKDVSTRITRGVKKMLSFVLWGVFGVNLSKKVPEMADQPAATEGMTGLSSDRASKKGLPKRIRKLLEQQQRAKNDAQDISAEVVTKPSNALMQFRLSELYASAPHLQELQMRLHEIDTEMDRDCKCQVQVSKEMKQGKGTSEGREQMEKGQSALKGMSRSEARNSMAIIRNKQISNAYVRRKILSSLQLAVLAEAAARMEAFLEEFNGKIVKNIGKVLQTSVPVELCDLQKALHQNVDYQKQWQIIAILPKYLTTGTVHNLQQYEKSMMRVALQAITDASDRRNCAVRRITHRLEYRSLYAWQAHSRCARKTQTRVAAFLQQHKFRMLVWFFSSWCYHYQGAKAHFEAEVLRMEEQIAQLQHVSESWIEYEQDDASGKFEFVGHVLPVLDELRPHGQGAMMWRDGSHFFGEWKQGMTSGIGHEVYSDGSSYIGSFEKDKRHGMGIFTTAIGDTYTGYWAEGERHGLGISIEKVDNSKKHREAGVGGGKAESGKTSIKKSVLSVFGEFASGRLEKRLQDPEQEQAVEEKVHELVRRAAAQADVARSLATQIKARSEGVNWWQKLGGSETISSQGPLYSPLGGSLAEGSPIGASVINNPSSSTANLTRGRAPSMLASSFKDQRMSQDQRSPEVHTRAASSVRESVEGPPSSPPTGQRPPNSCLQTAFVRQAHDSADGEEAGTGKKGSITPKEYEGFSLLDTDGDGVITREKFNCASGAPFTMLNKDGDGQISRVEWNAGFASFDTDKDGYITAKEFNALTHPGFLFDALDRDGDGKLTREEYNAVFDAMDLNKNRRLRREEFSGAYFSMLDKDGDGQLSKEEYEGFDMVNFHGDAYISKADKVKTTVCLQSHLRRAILKERYQIHLALFSAVLSSSSYSSSSSLLSVVSNIIVVLSFSMHS